MSKQRISDEELNKRISVAEFVNPEYPDHSSSSYDAECDLRDARAEIAQLKATIERVRDDCQREIDRQSKVVDNSEHGDGERTQAERILTLLGYAEVQQ